LYRKDEELCPQSVLVIINVTPCINMNGNKTWEEVREDVILTLLSLISE
jgi:hypothetical protein